MVAKRADTIAKEMFFVGLLGLPWLWIVNIMYFWDVVYGRLPCFGINPSSTTNEEEVAGFLGMMENNDDDEEGEIGDENGNNNAPTQEEIKAEVCKWVKRSSIGSAFVLTISVAWMLVFQLNRDNFGPKWFVMPEDDEERTGW